MELARRRIFGGPAGGFPDTKTTERIREKTGLGGEADGGDGDGGDGDGGAGGPGGDGPGGYLTNDYGNRRKFFRGDVESILRQAKQDERQRKREELAYGDGRRFVNDGEIRGGVKALLRWRG
jgi:hypothetical protein